MQFILLASAVLAAASSVAGAPTESKPLLSSIPAGSPNVFYSGSLREDGTTEWIFLGKHNHDIEKRDGASCAGFGTPTEDVNTAQSQLANLFGNGYYWTSRSIASTYNSGVAYGCNYGNGQTSTSGQYWSDIAAVNSQCGFTNGAAAGVGWYSHDSRKASYGHTANSAGYC